MSMFLTDSGLVGHWVAETATGQAGSSSPFNPSDYDYVKFTLTGSSWRDTAVSEQLYWTGILSPTSIEVTIPTTGSGTFSASGIIGQFVTGRSGPDDQGNYAWTAYSRPSATNIVNSGKSSTCPGTAVYTYEWSGDNHDKLVIHMPSRQSPPYAPIPPYLTFTDPELTESGHMYYRTAGTPPGWVITTSHSGTSDNGWTPRIWTAFGDSASSYTAYRASASFAPYSSEAQ